MTTTNKVMESVKYIKRVMYKINMLGITENE